MSERTFTIEMTENERLMALTALGFCVVRLPEMKPRIVVADLIHKLTDAAGQDVDPTPRERLKPPAPVPAQVRDYFQKDRRGKEQLNAPADAELKTVKVISAQELTSSTPGKAPYMKVIFGGKQASCFDPILFPLIVRRTGEDAQFWFVQSGKYWNIVGVRA